MNIGIRLHDTAPGTFRERLGFARAQGFSCAHIALGMTLEGFSMQNAPRLLTRELSERIKSDLADTGLECAVLGCYLNLADPDEERRTYTQEIYKAHLRAAPWIGARVVGTETYANPASRFDEPAARSEEAFRLFMDSLRPVVRYAEEAGAILAVEPVYHHIISTPERAERMLDELPSDHLQIILDAVNLIGPGCDEQAEALTEEAIRRLGDRVRILHMKDYVVQQDGGIHSQACGTGRMRFDALLALAARKELPMTLEDTVPDNAETARLHLERIAKAVQTREERRA